MSTDHLTFTLFPKDAVENRGSISVLLRDGFKNFKPRCLPAAIFRRNRGLTGSLRATHTKTYGPNDKTRSGVSKNGWRLVLLQGCPQFMRSLEAYDEDEKFNLGSGFIFIRGGVRKPRSNPIPRGRGGPRLPRSNVLTGPGGSGRDQRYASMFPSITEEPRIGRGRGRGVGNLGAGSGGAPDGASSTRPGQRPGPSSWGGC